MRHFPETCKEAEKKGKMSFHSTSNEYVKNRINQDTHKTKNKKFCSQLYTNIRSLHNKQEETELLIWEHILT